MSSRQALCLFGVLLLSPLPLLVAQGPPEFSRLSIVNAATLSGPPRLGAEVGRYFGVGSIITVFGRNLATETASASRFPLPTELVGTQVTFNVANESTRVPGRLLYVSPTQINLVTPATHRFFSSISVKTLYGTVDDHYVLVHEADPGIFTRDASGCGPPALWSHRLGRMIGPSDAVAPGEIVTLYGTGFGPPYAPDGEPAPADPPLEADPVYRYGAVLGDGAPGGLQEAEVLWQGKAPGWSGGDQFNIRIPETAPEGCAAPFRVTNPALYYTVRSSQILSLPISRNGACQDPPRDAFLRLVLVREVNSGVPTMPTRRDRLWVDFFGGPPPETSPFDRARSFVTAGANYCSAGERFRGRMCPGLEGVSEDAMADPLVYDSRHWEAKISQDAGAISVSSAGETVRLPQGLPNGLPYYPSELPANFLQDGHVRVSAGGGRHVGAFDAEITLPPFAMVDNLPPGTVIGSRRVGLDSGRFSGGSPKGIVRWWVGEAEC
ncbi:MAG: hypothetical protein KIT09_21275, partial [Bryobacteraceae bacterium]|nr:hypothetical protein [Bryobacteraceae bacterium]